ncbi:hypothetical protein KP509_25G044500 [Ceratopteris richardii]|uniref:Uncharacterized protein n=1 Tax=Ceratopteris richardii TaxID=49495 RepID=A0A8T2RQQ5_CERRI|nr:hypothetical protein KP509_25G044500 [Ceratopteris richardii]
MPFMMHPYRSFMTIAFICCLLLLLFTGPPQADAQKVEILQFAHTRSGHSVEDGGFALWKPGSYHICTQAVDRPADAATCICSESGLCLRHLLLALMLLHLELHVRA